VNFDNDEIWRNDSKNMRSKLKIAPNHRPYTGGRNGKDKVALPGVPDSERMRDLLDVAWADRMKSGKGTSNFYCNVSEGVARKPWTDGIKTFTTRACMYDFERARVISTIEVFAIHGYPVGDMDLDSCSEHELHTLVGQCMSLPCCATIEMAFFLNSFAPWWDCSTESRENLGGLRQNSNISETVRITAPGSDLDDSLGDSSPGPSVSAQKRRRR
jgi:hypothetical protein